MKKITSLIIVLFLLFSLHAQKELSYQVKHVDLYLSGAKLYTQAQSYLEKGTHSLVIKNVSSFALTATTRVKMSDGVTLVSINPSINYLDEAQPNETEKKLITRRDAIKEELKMLEIETSTLTSELALMKNYLEKPQEDKEKMYGLEEVKNIVKYYTEKEKMIQKEKYEIEKKQKEKNEELARIERQLNEESQYKSQQNQLIEMTVEVGTAGNKIFDIEYFVNNCGWTPTYDIKAESKENPIQITYKAAVWQRTGIDWDNVKLTLMTNKPVENQNRPILNPVYLYYSTPETAGAGVSEKRKDNSMYMNMLEVSSDAYFDASMVQNEITVTDINLRYDIAATQSFKTNGKQVSINITSKEVKGRFVYHAVPKISEKVFLLAYLPNWQNLNLLNGMASIYMQGVYIGNVQINEQYTDEEYPLSFGEDNRVIIKRNREDYTVTVPKIGSEKKESHTYQIIIRNQLATSIDLEILDLIPISTQQTIRVNLINQGGAEYTETTGLLKWNIPINAGETKEVRFSYEIKYPKDGVLIQRGF
ncbi:MAG: DUF4139 domain-containing protein [Bacteroidales bacterium]|jgi:uncharacterized protein (TIGR02231 family)|nr:DUF4139 domain-containing protein [Bacteroidales bacterium]